VTSLDAGSRLSYLGPEGTFTHEAALSWASDGVTLIPVRTVTDVYAGISAGEFTHGVVAIENSVEGYVVPSLDAIVAADNVVAIDECFVSIAFDAFAHPDSNDTFDQVSSHPHGLAQCRAFIARLGLLPVPATSNAAACRDVVPGRLALGPRICGEIYGLRTWERSVEDFHGARTRFLLLTSRDAAVRAGRPQGAVAEEPGQGSGIARSATGTLPWRTMLAVTPHLTGPGVLARITAAFGALGVNMSSLITRPLKALEARYVFILTVDGAPWEPAVHSVLADLLGAGDSVKTLGVFPSRGDIDAAVDVRRVPPGSVQAALDGDWLQRGLLWS
jgi:prephenate dehydratase